MLGNNIVGINNKQSSRGCWLEGRRLLRESPRKSMILVRSGEHKWQSSARNSRFPVRGRGHVDDQQKVVRRPIDIKLVKIKLTLTIAESVFNDFVV